MYVCPSLLVLVVAIVVVIAVTVVDEAVVVKVVVGAGAVLMQAGWYHFHGGVSWYSQHRGSLSQAWSPGPVAVG